MLTPGNFNEEGGFRLRPEKERFYMGDIPDAYVLEAGDLIVAMTEQGPGLLGSSALIPENGKYLHNQRLGLIHNLDQKRLDKRFLYYLFNTRIVRGQISGSATGTKVRHTAPDRIYRVNVSVPSDTSEQKKIAGILSAYDDLIENNRRRIQLLEQAARLLYKEWFVHLRFPGHEHVQIKDGLPEGWERKTLGDIAATNVNSFKPSEYHQNHINPGRRHIRSVARWSIAILLQKHGQCLRQEHQGEHAEKLASGDIMLVKCSTKPRAYALILDPEEN